jgi:pseudouridylate synthase
MEKKMRLDKCLVEMGLGSRTEVKQLLKKQQVLVNGKVVTSAKVQVDEYQDEISVNKRVLDYEKFVYYLLNKPKGVISATEDANHQTVLDLLDESARQKEVFPVGRLDIDTHGLLLLTNNGALAHAMLSPKKHVAKVYCAKVDGIMTEKDRTRFEAGIKLKDFTCKPAQLTILETNEEQGTSLVEITISEGKFHQVKRMVAACGKKVADLERLAMGPLTLDKELATGTFRRLTQEEIKSLKRFGVELL